MPHSARNAYGQAQGGAHACNPAHPTSAVNRAQAGGFASRAGAVIRRAAGYLQIGGDTLNALAAGFGVLLVAAFCAAPIATLGVLAFALATMVGVICTEIGRALGAW